MDLNFTIGYKQGSTNAAVDALSRCSPVTTVCALSACTPAWIGNLIDGYNSDPTSIKLLEQLAISNTNDQGYSLTDGVIHYKGRIWIGNNSLAQQHVI